MNDLLEALKTRLSSPIWGYFSLALFAFNWEAFFYLTVQDGDVLGRIKFFQDHTTIHSLVSWPLAFSFAIASLHPWVLFVLAWITVKPIELKDIVQANSEHRLLLRKKHLEDARSSLLASTEFELIERAKRDQELDKLQSDDLKEKLKVELEKLRTERDSLRGKNQSSLTTTRHKELMEIAGNYRERADKTTSILDRENLIERARDLENQAHQLVVKSADSELRKSTD